jgi:hypothetical protein
VAIGLSSSGGGQFDLAAGQAGKGTVRGAYSEIALFVGHQDHGHGLGVDRLDDRVRRGRQETIRSAVCFRVAWGVFPASRASAISRAVIGACARRITSTALRNSEPRVN